MWLVKTIFINLQNVVPNHEEFLANFHTFLSSDINLTNTFWVKFGVLNGPRVSND